MQIQKKEMKNDILKAAEYEFLHKGYKNASIRLIAKRANTTIGNVYNYFPNKESLLDAIVGDVPERLHYILYHHQDEAISLTELSDIDIFQMDINEIGDLIEKMIPEIFPIDILFCNATIILMEGCEGTKYESYQKDTYDVFHQHLMAHLPKEKSTALLDTFTTAFMSGVIYAAKHKKDTDDGNYIFKKLIKLAIIGLYYSFDTVTIGSHTRKN